MALCCECVQQCTWWQGEICSVAWVQAVRKTGCELVAWCLQRQGGGGEGRLVRKLQICLSFFFTVCTPVVQSPDLPIKSRASFDKDCQLCPDEMPRPVLFCVPNRVLSFSTPFQLASIPFSLALSNLFFHVSLQWENCVLHLWPFPRVCATLTKAL